MTCMILVMTFITWQIQTVGAFNTSDKSITDFAFSWLTVSQSSCNASVYIYNVNYWTWTTEQLTFTDPNSGCTSITIDRYDQSYLYWKQTAWIKAQKLKFYRGTTFLKGYIILFNINNNNVEIFDQVNMLTAYEDWLVLKWTCNSWTKYSIDYTNMSISSLWTYNGSNCASIVAWSNIPYAYNSKQFVFSDNNNVYKFNYTNFYNQVLTSTIAWNAMRVIWPFSSKDNYLASRNTWTYPNTNLLAFNLNNLWSETLTSSWTIWSWIVLDDIAGWVNPYFYLIWKDSNLNRIVLKAHYSCINANYNTCTNNVCTNSIWQNNGVSCSSTPIVDFWEWSTWTWWTSTWSETPNAIDNLTNKIDDIFKAWTWTQIWNWTWTTLWTKEITDMNISDLFLWCSKYTSWIELTGAFSFLEWWFTLSIPLPSWLWGWFEIWVYPFDPFSCLIKTVYYWFNETTWFVLENNTISKMMDYSMIKFENLDITLIIISGVCILILIIFII